MCASQFTHEENAIYVISYFKSYLAWAEPIFLYLISEMAPYLYVKTCLATLSFFSISAFRMPAKLSTE